MARDGNGNYNLPEAPFVFDTVIDEGAVNNNFADVGAALTQSLSKDGQTVPTGNLPMGARRHTGVGDATARNNYAAAGQVQDGAFVWCGTAGGTANALTLAPSPAITAYVEGQKFRFRAGAAANTDAVTIAISGLTAVAGQIDDAALTGGEIEPSKYYDALYDGTQIQLTRLSEAPPPTPPPPRGHIFGLTVSNNAVDADHDLDIAAGECASDAASPVMITLGAAITKRLDAVFAEGTGNGGMASGNALGPSRTLVIWAISKADGTADVIATDGSGDALSLTLPTGFVHKRVIMLLRTDGSSSVRGFSQLGDTILWDSTSADVEAVNPGTSASLRSLSVPSLRPVEALGVVTLLQNDVDTTVAALISSLDQTDQVPVVGGAHTLSLHSYAASRTTTGFRVRTNAIGQIRSRLSVSNANTTLYLATEGYVYDRRSF